MQYQERKFNLPALNGISQKSVEEHLGLYAGYVKNFNAMSVLIEELLQDSEKNTHAIAEIMRRRSFEFGGMRLHEHYFTQWEQGARSLDPASALAGAIQKQFEGHEHLIKVITNVGLMRGPGWALLYWDREAGQFQIGFSGEQHQGHFVTLPIILALDVWEHAYLLDYGAQGKAKYIDAFFNNLNWSVIEERYQSPR